MDTPTPSADALLTQPTRARLFRALGELKREASTEELAARVGLHVNGVRRQLEQLRQAGLLDRRKNRSGRGRPRDLWAIAPQANPGGERPHAYAELATWLAATAPAGPGGLREIEAAGRKIGRSVAPAGATPSGRAFEQAVTALGFQPQLEIQESGDARCRLCNCPYRDAVRERPDVICALHRGITAGLVDELAPGATLVAFEPQDPDRAGCLIELAGTNWSE